MGPRMWNVEELRCRGYRTGSILRVQMHNFITYDDAEVFPGPRLNIILGPNGTGKSTLTHAICLACAGVPSSVGRSDDLRHFIKRGKELDGCFCEVDILLKNDTVVTVRRTLNHETKGSKWQLNRKSVQQREIKALMLSLHIDVDNLCTFMPQDRVSAFTQMNSKKLLQSTLECIKMDNGKSLHDEQKELADTQEISRNAEREVESENQLVIQLEAQIRGMAGEVERIQNRDKLQEKLQMYDVRLAVLVLEERAMEVEEKQAAIDKANLDLAEAQAAIQPFEENVRELQRQQAIHTKNTTSVANKKIKADERLDAAREHVEELDIQTETAKRNVETHAAVRRQQEEELRHMNERLRQLDEKYQALVAQVPAYQEQLTAATSDYENASHKANDLSDQLTNKIYQLRAPQSRIDDMQFELNRVKDSREVFCNKLQGRSTDVITAMKWIDQNKHRFRGECYGPVGVEVEVKTAEDAAMLEKVVSFQKLITFLVDNDADEKLLNSELRSRLRLQVNITTMHNKNITPPSFSREFLYRAREEFGFEGFLGEKFDMPDMVRAYLNNFTGLHTILCSRGPKASELVTPSVIQELANPFFRLFALDTDGNGGVRNITDYSGRKSRFASGKSDVPSTKSVSVKPAKLLGMTNHAETQQQRARLEAELAEAKSELHNIEQEVQLTRESLQQTQVLRDEHRSKCRSLKQAISQPDSMRTALIREENKRNDLSKKLENSSGKERQDLITKLNQKVNETLQGVSEIHNRCQTALETSIWKDYVFRTSRGVQAELFRVKEALDEAKQVYNELKNQVKALEEQRNIAKDQKLDAENVISALEEEMGSEEKLNEFFIRASKEITENTHESLLERRDQVAGQLEATVDNPELMTQYQKALNDANDARIRHAEKLHRLNNMQEQVANREGAWLDNVHVVITKLNKDFGRFMKELHFAGEVGLEEQGSFLDYAVEMRVNFRSDGGSCLQPLSGLSHSGGERSVSTVMYLMALQELTSAPFRVVDEINQGMDERNERLVFDRIVRSCCSKPSYTSVIDTPTSASLPQSSNSIISTPSKSLKEAIVLTPSSTGFSSSEGVTAKAQYFLVSPKLLPGLRAMDNEDVTVLMVYNGPGVNDLWQMNDVISALRKRKHHLIEMNA